MQLQQGESHDSSGSSHLPLYQRGPRPITSYLTAPPTDTLVSWRHSLHPQLLADYPCPFEQFPQKLAFWGSPTISGFPQPKETLQNLTQLFPLACSLLRIFHTNKVVFSLPITIVILPFVSWSTVNPLFHFFLPLFHPHELFPEYSSPRVPSFLEILQNILLMPFNIVYVI